jgi:hypothetical protein
MLKNDSLDRTDFQQQSRPMGSSLKETVPGEDVEQHSLVKSMVLHLLRGVLIALFYVIVARWVISAGFPAINALLLAAVFVLIPFQLGLLFYEGKKKNGWFSLKGIVVNREEIPVWQFIVLIPLLLIWSFFWFRH